MKYALMFNVLKDGEIETIKWGRDVFMPNRSIILLEELTPAVWLWHGVKQSLVDRRIASRQAEALKGYGYKAKDTIIGSRTRIIKEIDQRKVGKDAETDQFNQEFEELLNKKFEAIDDIIVAFQSGEYGIEKSTLRPQVAVKIIPEQRIEAVAGPIIAIKPDITQKPEVEVKISDIKPETQLKSTETKIKLTPKPVKPIKKQEFTFESQVQELEASTTTEIVKNVLKRIKKMEFKLDSLIKEFKEFKATFKKQ